MTACFKRKKGKVKMSFLSMFLFWIFAVWSVASGSGDDVTAYQQNFTFPIKTDASSQQKENSTAIIQTTKEQGNHSMNTTELPWQSSLQTNTENSTEIRTTETPHYLGEGSTSDIFQATFGNMTANSSDIVYQTKGPNVQQTPFPTIIQDINEDLVAGMSILVVLIFGSCCSIVVAKHFYRKRRLRKDDRGVFYEEVEDAATSCSIEGSSNIKFLVGRARNINKSRIEQINEEWMKEKPQITKENDIIANGGKLSTPELPKTDLKRISVDSEPTSGRVEAEEDSEYATAEPTEDIYSLAEDTVSESTSENRQNLNNNVPPPLPSNKRPSMKKLQRAPAFDDSEEDPYEETPEDEYDMVHSPRAHKPPKVDCLSDNLEASEEAEEVEHMYEITDDVSYDSVGGAHKNMDGIHRSKAQQVLFRKSKSSFPDNNNIYQESFDDEYDVLNKPRFRITVSSDNYDNVVLPYESEEQQAVSDQSRTCYPFFDLERKERAQSNVYSEVPVSKEGESVSTGSELLPEKDISESILCANQLNENSLQDENCNDEPMDYKDANESDILNILQQSTTNSDQDDQDSSNSSRSSICDLLGNVEATLSTSDVENKNYTFENKCYETVFTNGNLVDSKHLNSDTGNILNNELDRLIDDVNSVK